MTYFIVLSLFLLAFTNPDRSTGTLIVTVKGIKTHEGGELATAIFTRAHFPKTGKQLMGSINAVTASQIQIVFDEVPPGTYGVASFQDIDKNKQLTTNFIGYPTEPLGFSRDAAIKFGPPDFDDAKITVEPNKTLSITITLR